MNGRRLEMAHNTETQVREYLATALAITEDLDPDSDLRPLVFAKAVDLVSAKSIQVEQVTPGMPNMVVPRGL